MTTTWTKPERRDPSWREPIFREGARIVSRVAVAEGVLTAPQYEPGDVLLAEDTPDAGTRLVAFGFQPRAVERRWALFGLRRGDGDELGLWLRGDPLRFYGAPRRAEYRLAVLRPGEVTRVLHNAKNDFSATGRRERTYQWNDFVFEPLVVSEVRQGEATEERTLPLERAKIVDLREDLL